MTIDRYRVSYRRADGRNMQGVDVPYTFDSAVTFTVPTQGASLTPRLTPRKSIHTTVGDGSAVVVLRTFSGSVTIGKK